MLRKIALLILIALGLGTLFGGVAEAKKRPTTPRTIDLSFDERKDKLIETCPLFTINGWQVFRSQFEHGVCAGKAKYTRVVAHNRYARVLCFRSPMKCIHWNDMDGDQRGLFTEMAAFDKPIPAVKVCTTRSERWARYMVTAGDAPCDPSKNDAFEIDFDAKTLCVFLGSNLQIGCVTLTSDEVAIAATEHTQEVAKLFASKNSQKPAAVTGANVHIADKK